MPETQGANPTNEACHSSDAVRKRQPCAPPKLVKLVSRASDIGAGTEGYHDGTNSGSNS